MAFNDVYRLQVGLLIRALPLVAEEKIFALKGGTAINLFVRDMPRLSVDIDLTYLPVQGRPESRRNRRRVDADRTARCEKHSRCAGCSKPTRGSDQQARGPRQGRSDNH